MVKEQKFVTMDIDVLREQFDSFDKDGSGYLEAGEAVAALTAIGSKLSFADLGSDGDNKISFEEFSVRLCYRAAILARYFLPGEVLRCISHELVTHPVHRRVSDDPHG